MHRAFFMVILAVGDPSPMQSFLGNAYICGHALLSLDTQSHLSSTQALEVLFCRQPDVTVSGKACWCLHQMLLCLFLPELCKVLNSTEGSGVSRSSITLSSANSWLLNSSMHCVASSRSLCITVIVMTSANHWSLESMAHCPILLHSYSFYIIICEQG